MKFVPRSVMVGFVNALAILIFLAQLPQFVGAGWMMYAFVAAGLAIIYLLPRLTTAVPSPLVAIIVLTLLSLMMGGGGLRTVGDMGALPTTLPFFGCRVPLHAGDAEDHPAGGADAGAGGHHRVAADGVDRGRDDGHAERQEPGVARAGHRQHRDRLLRRHGGLRDDRAVGDQRPVGRTRRLSSFAGAGMFLLLFILVLADWLVLIPMGALVAVMFMVSIGTFDWSRCARCTWCRAARRR
jgi:sulfate permease, SulP family